MRYDYQYMNDIRVRIWLDESPFDECKSIDKVKKRYKIDTLMTADSRQLVVELKLPKNNSNYGMLGVTYHRNTSDADITVNLNAYDEDIYEGSIAVQPDIVHKGIPTDYVNGILKSIEKNKNELLRSGVYVFYLGAHGEVGSSANLFYILTNILLQLLFTQEINQSIAERIINNAIV